MFTELLTLGDDGRIAVKTQLQRRSDDERRELLAAWATHLVEARQVVEDLAALEAVGLHLDDVQAVREALSRRWPTGVPRQASTGAVIDHTPNLRPGHRLIVDYVRGR